MGRSPTGAVDQTQTRQAPRGVVIGRECAREKDTAVVARSPAGCLRSRSAARSERARRRACAECRCATPRRCHHRGFRSARRSAGGCPPVLALFTLPLARHRFALRLAFHPAGARPGRRSRHGAGAAGHDGGGQLPACPRAFWRRDPRPRPQQGRSGGIPEPFRGAAGGTAQGTAGSAWPAFRLRRPRLHPGFSDSAHHVGGGGHRPRRPGRPRLHRFSSELRQRGAGGARRRLWHARHAGRGNGRRRAAAHPGDLALLPLQRVAAAPELDPDRRQRIRQALLDFDPDADTERKFYHWERTEMARGFAPAEAADYRPLRDWLLRFGLLQGGA